MEGRPNAVRILRGRPVHAAAALASGVGASAEMAEVMVVECEIDDLPGEGFGFLMERLLAAGALDVYFTPVQMKKNRPGILVTLLCRRPQLEELAGLLLAESGSLGCRYHAACRFEAEREILEVATAFGAVRIKRARLDGRPLAVGARVRGLPPAGAGQRGSLARRLARRPWRRKRRHRVA